MSTAVAKPKMTAAQVVEAMASLNARQLELVMQRAALLRLQKRSAIQSTRDSKLLQIINRGLDSSKSERLGQLQEKLREETITHREREQLLRLSAELERLAGERLKALIELAALRKTSVPRLMAEMGLTEAIHA